MANLIYIKGLKFQKKCASCGENIPKDAPCWWDKEGKKNYHENHKPDQESSDKTLSKSFAYSGGLKNKNTAGGGASLPNLNPPSETSLKKFHQEFEEFDVEKNLKESIEIAERTIILKPITNGSGEIIGVDGTRTNAIAELMRERFELYLEQRKEKFWGKRID